MKINRKVVATWGEDDTNTVMGESGYVIQINKGRYELPVDPGEVYGLIAALEAVEREVENDSA